MVGCRQATPLVGASSVAKSLEIQSSVQFTQLRIAPTHQGSATSIAPYVRLALYGIVVRTLSSALLPSWTSRFRKASSKTGTRYFLFLYFFITKLDVPWTTSTVRRP